MKILKISWLNLQHLALKTECAFEKFQYTVFRCRHSQEGYPGESYYLAGSVFLPTSPLNGIYMALTEAVSKALIIDCVPDDSKGTALGILYIALGFSALSSNVLAGYFWDNYGKTVPFWIGSFTAIIAVLVTFLSGRLRVKGTAEAC